MTVIDIGGRRSRPARRGGTTNGRRGRTLYEQVISLVERLIVERGLRPGDLLPTQSELAEQAGVSLITVRRALDELERDGQVRRHQGVGTFLAHPKIVSRPTAAGSIGNTLGRSNPSPIVTNVLSMGRVIPSPELAEALRQDPGDELWRVRRQRLLDGKPIILETALIPVRLAPDLDRHTSDELGSLYELLAVSCGLEDDYEEQYLEVMTPIAQDRRLLGLPARSQVVRIRGLSVDKTGTPFDCFEQVYPAADFVFGMAGSASRQLLSEPAFRNWTVRESG